MQHRSSRSAKLSTFTGKERHTPQWTEVPRLLSTGSVAGVEAAAGESKLRYVELVGLGEPLTVMHVNEMSRYFVQASAALTYLHASGVMHRDIKPSNMIVMFLNDFDCH
jgi:serine/threonine protein kinase